MIKVIMNQAFKKIPNQKSQDIVKKNYSYEKKIEKEWSKLMKEFGSREVRK